jgi:hypothetical protein
VASKASLEMQNRARTRVPRPYKHIGNVGDVHSFVFKPGNEEPFYFITAEREAKKDDIMFRKKKGIQKTKSWVNCLPTKVLKFNSCAEETTYQ